MVHIKIQSVLENTEILISSHGSDPIIHKLSVAAMMISFFSFFSVVMIKACREDTFRSVYHLICCFVLCYQDYAETTECIWYLNMVDSAISCLFFFLSSFESGSGYFSGGHFLFPFNRDDEVSYL